jgi:hypothetical protein
VSSASDLNYDIAAKEGDKFEVFVTVADTPLVLHDINASEWKKNDFLKDVFKKPSACLSKRSVVLEQQKTNLLQLHLFFLSAFFLAKTLNDRLVIINWWLNQSKEQQQEHSKNFKVTFSHPTKSASPLPLRLSARGAAIAEARGIATKIISILDNQQLKEAHVATMAS